MAMPISGQRHEPYPANRRGDGDPSRPIQDRLRETLDFIKTVKDFLDARQEARRTINIMKTKLNGRPRHP